MSGSLVKAFGEDDFVDSLEEAVAGHWTVALVKFVGEQVSIRGRFVDIHVVGQGTLRIHDAVLFRPKDVFTLSLGDFGPG